MRRQENSHNIDLILLGKPIFIFSIFVLLLNDHVLKTYYPSWVTGKLSDFAGLFFFSILLGAVLNIIFPPFRLKQDQSASFAFGFTAIWFVLMKTLPFFNTLTENVLSRILFQNVQIILDPTDLIALAILLPAWRLRAQADAYHVGTKKNASYTVLVLGLLASLATGRVPSLSVGQFIVYEGAIYADMSGYFFDDKENIPYSTDGGKTWETIAVSDLPNQVVEKRGNYPKLPVSICIPNEPSICYCTDNEKILISSDGGKTWQTDWEIPLGRKKFMERYRKLDMGPYDLVVFPLKNGYRVLVAAGEEGILVKELDGDWKRQSVLGAGPTPYQANDPFDAFYLVLVEILVTSAVAILLLFLYVLVHAKTYGSVGIILSVLFIFVMIFIVWSFPIGYYTLNAAFILFLFLFFFMNVEAKINTVDRTNRGVKALGFVWLASIAFFVLWTTGIIPVYEISLVCAVSTNVAYFIWLLYRLVVGVEK